MAKQHKKPITQIWITEEAAAAVARGSFLSGFNKQVFASRALIAAVRQLESEHKEQEGKQ
jgi:hypothetical protein